MQIQPDFTPRGWGEREFRDAKAEGYRRWRETQAVLEIRYTLFDDAVCKVDPEFALTPGEEDAAWSVLVPHHSGACPNRVLLHFLRWERCGTTHGLPNPYEPWIEIWERGGALHVEHAQFVDVSFCVLDDQGRSHWQFV